MPSVSKSNSTYTKRYIQFCLGIETDSLMDSLTYTLYLWLIWLYIFHLLINNT